MSYYSSGLITGAGELLNGPAALGNGVLVCNADGSSVISTIDSILGYTPANDASVAHLAGPETITGAKLFSSNIETNSSIYAGGGATSGTCKAAMIHTGVVEGRGVRTYALGGFGFTASSSNATSDLPDTQWRRVGVNSSKFVGSDGTTLGTIQAAVLDSDSTLTLNGDTGVLLKYADATKFAVYGSRTDTSQDIRPTVDNSKNLGQAGYRFANVATTTVTNFGGELGLVSDGSSGVTFDGRLKIRPSSTSNIVIQNNAAGAIYLRSAPTSTLNIGDASTAAVSLGSLTVPTNVQGDLTIASDLTTGGQAEVDSLVVNGAATFYDSISTSEDLSAGVVNTPAVINLDGVLLLGNATYGISVPATAVSYVSGVRLSSIGALAVISNQQSGKLYLRATGTNELVLGDVDTSSVRLGASGVPTNVKGNLNVDGNVGPIKVNRDSSAQVAFVVSRDTTYRLTVGNGAGASRIGSNGGIELFVNDSADLGGFHSTSNIALRLSTDKSAEFSGVLKSSSNQLLLGTGAIGESIRLGVGSEGVSRFPVVKYSGSMSSTSEPNGVDIGLGVSYTAPGLWVNTRTKEGLSFRFNRAISAATGDLFELSEYGSKRLVVDKDGTVTFPAAKMYFANGGLGVISSVSGTDGLYLASEGTSKMRVNSSGVAIRGGYLSVASSPSGWATDDARLYADAADVLSIRRGTSPQKLRVYQTYDGTDDFYFNVDTTNATDLIVGTVATGAAVSKPLHIKSAYSEIKFSPGSLSRFVMKTNTFQPNYDNSASLGYPGNRWNTVYAYNGQFMNGIALRSGSADPSTLDVTDGYKTTWKNSTSGEIREWVNNGGVMYKSAAYTAA